MTKTNVVRKRLKKVKEDKRASRMLRVLRATGLFRWERPSTHAEEAMNILTHGIGIGLALAGLTLLVVFAAMYGNAWSVVSCAIFGVTMFTLYFGPQCAMQQSVKKVNVFSKYGTVSPSMR